MFMKLFFVYKFCFYDGLNVSYLQNSLKKEINDPSSVDAYELVDLNDDISEYENAINLINDEIDLTDQNDLVSNFNNSLPLSNESPFGTFSFLSSLINDQSLRNINFNIKDGVIKKE